MKTVEQLKSEIYGEVENSGFLKNIQAQVKSHVLDVRYHAHHVGPRQGVQGQQGQTQVRV